MSATNVNNWQVSGKGTFHIEHDGFHLMVFRRGSSYRVGVTPPWNPNAPIWGQREYVTQADAMAAAVAGIDHVKSQEPAGWREQRAAKLADSPF